MQEEAIKFIGNFLISGTISAAAKTLLAPIDRVKLILQNQDSALQVLKGQRKPYKGIIDTFVRLPTEQGFMSFWRGNGVNVLRIFPTQAFGFAFNDFYQSLFSQLSLQQKGVGLKYLAGGLAGSSAALVIYPLDFCQTRLATDVGSDFALKNELVKREFRGLRHCITKVYRTEGVPGYYKGVKVQIPGIFVYRSLYFGLYSNLKESYIGLFDQEMSSMDCPPVPIFTRFFIAMVSTMVAGFISYPFDTVGRRLMLESARPETDRLFKGGTLFAARMMYKQSGIYAFYKNGAIINAIRGTGSALVLVTYDEILHRTDWKNLINKPQDRR